MAVVGGRAFVDCRSRLSGIQASRGTDSGLALKLDYAALCGPPFSLTGTFHSFFFFTYYNLLFLVSCLLCSHHKRDKTQCIILL